MLNKQENIVHLIAIIFFLNFTWISAALKPLVPSEAYMQSFSVDKKNPNQFKIFWSVIKNEILFEVHCKTTGWVGVGISPDGKMIGGYISIY